MLDVVLVGQAPFVPLPDVVEADVHDPLVHEVVNLLPGVIGPPGFILVQSGFGRG